MKYTAHAINKLVAHIRSGQPLRLPEGAREQHFHDPALPGFYIRALNTGVASWVVQYKLHGRQKKITIGSTLVLDRSDAIDRARKLLAKVMLDRLDPHEARRERMRAAKVTLATVTPLFMADKMRRGLRSSTVRRWGDYLIDGYHFRPLHNLPIDEITREQIQTRVEAVVSQSGPVTATNCCTAMRVFYKWAIKTGKLPDGYHSPMQNVQPPPPADARARVLGNDEIQLIWRTCELWPSDHSPIIRLLFLTGCRAQEIGDLRKSEVDLDAAELLIPGSRTKNKQPLSLPLAGMAVQILRDGLPERQGSERQCRPNEELFFGRRVQISHANEYINDRITKEGWAPLPHWTVHDIRRTFRTRLSECGVSHDIGELLVNHIGHRSAMNWTYDRYEFWVEKRQAVELWETKLRAIIDGTAEKVVRPRFRQKESAA